MRKRLVAVIAATGLLFAACGDDDNASSGTTAAATVAPATSEASETTEASATTDASATSDGAATTEATEATEAPPEDLDPEGVAKFAYDLAAASRGGFKWDPSTVPNPTTDMGIYLWVYGTLLRPTGAGEIVPELAESVEVVDPNTVEIVVRDGVTLSDGTPMDGEMVKTILESNLAKADNPAYRPGFYAVESIDLTPPNTLTLHIPDGSAASWPDQYLTGSEAVMVPPGTNFDKPIGAGPFTVAAYTAGQTLTLEKNPKYWNADAIKVAGIEMTGIPSDNPQAATGALNAKQVDWTRLNYAIIDAVGGDAEVLVEADPEYETQIQICKTTAPFDDVKVRQALNLATDREAINQAMFKGEGAVAWDLWPEGHPLHNPDLTGAYEYDPEAAKTLLAEAGVSDLTVDLIPIPSAAMPEISTILQQQWDAVGITLNIVPTTQYPQDFLINNLAPLGGTPRSGLTRAKLDNFNGDVVSNPCRYNDPELAALIAELGTVSDKSDEGIELWHQIQKIIVDDALFVPILFQPLAYGIDPDRLGGYDLVSYFVISVPDMWELYVKS